MIRADKRKYHYIYKITRFDGKYYIGMHSTDKIEDGYFGSGKLITRSIKKHGIDKHTKEILELLSSRTELKIKERQIVNEEIVDDPKCMNLRLGGDGWESTEASKAAISGNRSSNRDHKTSNAKAVLTKKARGSGNFFGGGCNWTGRTHSEEAKKKIGLANSIAQAGEKNPNFGTCWVVKENIKPIKIKKEQLDEYIQNGYSRGRKNIGLLI